MAPVSNKSNLRAELVKFVRDVSPDTPYGELSKLLRDAEWFITVRETALLSFANGNHGDDVIVRFELLIGRDAVTLEALDTISVRVPPNVPDISIQARQRAEIAATYMLFGRFPPVQPAVAPSPPPDVREVRMNGASDGDVVIDDYDDESQQEYVDDAPAEPLRLVERREPDGLPIFVDLFGVGEPTAVVVKELLREVGAFLEEATSVEQIDALARKNPDMLTFLRDLGEPADRAALKALVDKRRGQVAAGIKPTAPRRRVAASQAH